MFTYGKMPLRFRLTPFWPNRVSADEVARNRAPGTAARPTRRADGAPSESEAPCLENAPAGRFVRIRRVRDRVRPCSNWGVPFFRTKGGRRCRAPRRRSPSAPFFRTKAGTCCPLRRRPSISGAPFFRKNRPSGRRPRQWNPPLACPQRRNRLRQWWPPRRLACRRRPPRAPPRGQAGSRHAAVTPISAGLTECQHQKSRKAVSAPGRRPACASRSTTR